MIGWYLLGRLAGMRRQHARDLRLAREVERRQTYNVDGWTLLPPAHGPRGTVEMRARRHDGELVRVTGVGWMDAMEGLLKKIKEKEGHGDH